MILMQMTLGDLHAYVTASQSLDKADPMPVHYTLHVLDMPTGRTGSMAATDEMDAITLFSGLIWSDESLEHFVEAIARLRANLPGWCLP